MAYQVEIKKEIKKLVDGVIEMRKEKELPNMTIYDRNNLSDQINMNLEMIGSYIVESIEEAPF